MTPFYESPQVRIFCGHWEEVWPMLGLTYEDVALCWADGPYGKKEKTTRRTRKSGVPIRGEEYGTDGRDWAPVAGDDRPFDPEPLLRFPRLVTWGANFYADRLPPSSSWWWWDKRDGTTPDDNADGELAWTSLGGPARQFSHLWRGLCQASEKQHGGQRLHPTQKPVALCEWGFKQAGLNAGDLVFAPYLGSGPEVRAALNMGLRIIGCDVVEDYCRTVVDHRIAIAAPIPGREGQGLLPL